MSLQGIRAGWIDRYKQNHNEKMYYRPSLYTSFNLEADDSRYFLIYHQYQLMHYLNEHVDFEHLQLNKFTSQNLNLKIDFSSRDRADYQVSTAMYDFRGVPQWQDKDTSLKVSLVFGYGNYTKEVREPIKETYETSLAILKKQGRLPHDFDIDVPGFKLEPPIVPNTPFPGFLTRCQDALRDIFFGSPFISPHYLANLETLAQKYASKNQLKFLNSYRDPYSYPEPPKFYALRFNTDLIPNNDESRYLLVYHLYQLCTLFNEKADLKTLQTKRFNNKNIKLEISFKNGKTCALECPNEIRYSCYKKPLIKESQTIFRHSKEVGYKAHTSVNSEEPFEETIAILKKQGRLPQDFEIDTPGFKLDPPKSYGIPRTD